MSIKKFPKLVQVDARGQIVIPKDIRNELGIESGTGFWMFSVEKEGIMLKKVEEPDFENSVTEKIRDKADALDISKENIDSTSKKYKNGKGGRLDVI